MECYICLDSTEPLYKIYNCKCNLVIHKKCLLDLLKKTKHNKNCSICKQFYNIREFKIDKGWILDKKYSLKLCVVYSISLLLILTLIIIFILIKIHSIVIIYTTSIILCLLFILISLMHLHIYYKYKKICCVRKLIEKIKKIHLIKIEQNELLNNNENIEEEFEIL